MLKKLMGELPMMKQRETDIEDSSTDDETCEKRWSRLKRYADTREPEGSMYKTFQIRHPDTQEEVSLRMCWRIKNAKAPMNLVNRNFQITTTFTEKGVWATVNAPNGDVIYNSDEIMSESRESKPTERIEDINEPSAHKQ